MKRIYLLVLAAAAVLLIVGGATALAGGPGSTTCNNTTLGSNSYGSVTVMGTCQVALGSNITINGDLTLSDGSVFAGFTPSTVHVTGNVKVGKGALLQMGYGTETDVVDGNINANQPLNVELGFVTIHGNVVSNGGGPGTDAFLNFPLKNNTIDGNLIVHGWQGGWFGLLRNTVGGNIDVSNVASVLHQTPDSCGEGTAPPCTGTAPGPDPDSTEIVDNTVGGNVICQNNVPAAQVGDSGGGPNIVSGNKIGECNGPGL